MTRSKAYVALRALSARFAQLAHDHRQLAKDKTRGGKNEDAVFYHARASAFDEAATVAKDEATRA